MKDTYWICPLCGPRVGTNEDGCCVTCGSMTCGSEEEWYLAALAQARADALEEAAQTVDARAAVYYRQHVADPIDEKAEERWATSLHDAAAIRALASPAEPMSDFEIGALMRKIAETPPVAGDPETLAYRAGIEGNVTNND